MSSYEDDHPSTSSPDVEAPGLSLDEILDELEASDGGMVLVDENGRRLMGDGVVEMLAGAMGSRSQRGASASYISNLPSISHNELTKEEESCGICQMPLLTLVDEEEHHLALDSPATSRETLGVVKIGSCSHLFCRRDASKWLSKSNSCPLCRSVCDPSQQQLTADSPAAPTEPPFPGAPNLPPNQQQMMDMLQSMFGTGGGGGLPDQATRRREEERESFSGMYS